MCLSAVTVACAGEDADHKERADSAVASIASGAEGKPQNAATAEPREVSIGSYHDLEDLFVTLDYTPESWMAGVREVPRMYITEIPDRWSKRAVKEIDVLTKKRLFFRVLAPLALRSNELTLLDRERMTSLLSQSALSPEDAAWLRELAVAYRADPEAYAGHVALVEALMPQVDIVPVSLVLSQAAEESGWGTSRFAFTGNALFGQWTWGEGMTPAGQRSGKGDYKIAAFDAPLDSVRAHALNLNSHPAYAAFREMRSRVRESGETLRGKKLATALTSYSERGEDYVDTLQTIMRVNRLADTDTAYLADMQPILLVPAESAE